jgi:hypothetical protein
MNLTGQARFRVQGLLATGSWLLGTGGWSLVAGLPVKDIMGSYCSKKYRVF